MFFNTVTNSVVVRLWGDNSGRPMQALNIGWPIGACLGPLIAVPFVSRDEDEEIHDNFTESSTTSSVYADVTEEAGDSKYADGSQIEVACWIVAGVVTSVACVHFVQYAYLRARNLTDIAYHQPTESAGSEVGISKTPKSSTQDGEITSISYTKTPDAVSLDDLKTTDDASSDASEETMTWRNILTPGKWAAGDARLGVIIATLTVTFYVVLIWSAMGVGGYLTVYATDSGMFSNEEAARLQSGVFLFALIGDAVAFIMAKYFSFNAMLGMQSHLQLLAGILMLAVGTQSSIGLWVTCCFYTAVREPTFGTIYGWAGRHIILYAFIISMIGITLSISNIFMGSLQGWLYTNTVIESIFYTAILFQVVNCFVVYVMIYVTHNRDSIQTILQRLKSENPSTDKATCTPDENAHEDLEI